MKNRVALVGSAIACAVLLVSCGGGSSDEPQAPPPPPIPPTVTLSLSPDRIPVGGSSTVTWSSANATSCQASGGWAGPRGTSGSANIGPIGASATFTLACTGTGGTVTTTASVSVPVPPTIALTADPAKIITGRTTKLTWNTTDATSCNASGSWSGAKSGSGSEAIGPLSASSTFSLSCTGAGGARTETATVETVTVPLNFRAKKSWTLSGSVAVLSWDARQQVPIDECHAAGDWSGGLPHFGIEPVGPLLLDSAFVLSCSTPFGSVSEQVSIDVLPGPPTDPQDVEFQYAEIVTFDGRDADHVAPTRLVGEPLLDAAPVTFFLVLRGDPTNASFTLATPGGSTLAVLQALAVVETPSVIHDYRATVQLPTQPFQVVAEGTDGDGAYFRTVSKVFAPQPVAVRFPSTVGIASPGYAVTDLGLMVRNVGVPRELIVTVVSIPDIDVTPEVSRIVVDGEQIVPLSFAVPSQAPGVELIATVETAGTALPAHRNTSAMTITIGGTN